MRIIGSILAFGIKLISLPLITLGYCASFASALIYYGWVAANRHQAFLVGLHDERDQSKGQEGE